MTIIVPFDGSELSKSALVRAVILGEAFGEEVLAVSIVPDDNAEYARKRGWLESDETFDRELVRNRLCEVVKSVAPSASIRHEFVDRHASAGTIATRLTKIAGEADASLIAIGSDNAGHMVSSIHSVGSTVAADEAYDVLIVRRPMPTDVDPEELSGW